MENAYDIIVRYSQFEPQSLQKELISRYSFKEPINCSLYDAGINDIYIVNVENCVYYLRISQTGMHEQIDYEQELEIINTLAKNDISVATPLPTKEGDYLWKINAPEGPRYAVLFHEAVNTPSENTEKQLFHLGKMLASLHLVADEHAFDVNRAPIDLEQLSIKPLEVIEPHLKQRQEDFNYLKSSAKELCNYVKSNLSLEKPYYGYCHGDIHSGNVFFHGDKPTIFDFDCMGYSWRAYDICVFAWNKSFKNESYIDSKEWQAFLNGYNSIRQLSEIEISSIPVFAALRELWLMGLHANMINRNAGCSWYNDDYFNFRIKIFKSWYNRAFGIQKDITE